MNRRLFQFRYSFERDVVEYFAKITIGAAGAPTLTIGKGIASVTRNSAGNYTLALQDSSNTMLSATLTNQNSTAAAAPLMRIASEQVSSSTSPSVTIQCADTTNAATDPANGEILLVKIAVRNASN